MPAVATQPALRAVRLTRSFGDGAQRRCVLCDVSLDLYPGQLALLMGPSGSGKSTLLAILSGLLNPDSGQVLARNGGEDYVDLWSLSDKQRERYRRGHTGFVFQGFNLFPALTALQQLEIVLKWGQDLGTGAARRKSAEMLERLGLGDQMYKKPAQLSGGERQRVAIGRAMVKGPTLLFADEPTSALDWENGQQVIDLLRDSAHERGAAIFIVSHDPRMLSHVDVVYHIADGKLEVTDRNGHNGDGTGGAR
jgi:putative ABC transport system ATP-binding protein